VQASDSMAVRGSISPATRGSSPNRHDPVDQTMTGPLCVCTVREKKMIMSVVAVFHSHGVYCIGA